MAFDSMKIFWRRRFKQEKQRKKQGNWGHFMALLSSKFPSKQAIKVHFSKNYFIWLV